MDVLALITARGGSKGLPRKNVLPLAGKPLIAWTISAALASHCFTRVIVSTDDEEIADVSRKWGAEVPFMRPPELAQDDSVHFDTIVHAIRWLDNREEVRPDYVMQLQPTSPLRTAEDINAAVQIVQAGIAVAVVGVSVTEHHPYLMKRILEDGTAVDFVSSDATDLRRQALPTVYSPNGAIFLNSRESLLQDRTFWLPGTHAYIMPSERSLDIDTAWDLYLADLILRDRCERKRA